MKSAQTQHFMACFQSKPVLFKLCILDPLTYASLVKMPKRNLSPTAPAAKKIKYLAKFRCRFKNVVISDTLQKH
jgi:hypothetical protein